MTRTQWKQLPEREREAIRQASAEASLHDFAPRDMERAMDVWVARDVYRVEGAGFAYLVVALLTMAMVMAGVFLR